MSKNPKTPETKPEIKYPRVMVSIPRHKKLAAEAKRRKMSIADVAEEKFKVAK